MTLVSIRLMFCDWFGPVILTMGTSICTYDNAPEQIEGDTFVPSVTKVPGRDRSRAELGENSPMMLKCLSLLEHLERHFG